ncbi:HupE/UreJ family protein [Thalassolituus sp.]|uniref:HupE/UreJ family protein n=1 Tax=Thalassolituus sp. TaxID=2030822 RepID=UPI0035131C13
MRILLLIFLLFPAISSAHQSSTALLTLKEVDEGLRGSLQWQLIDLEQSLGLDRNRNGELLWGEVKAMTPEIQALLARHLVVRQGGGVCEPRFKAPLRFNNARGAMASAIIPVTFLCERDGDITLTYSGMFSQLPEHRLLWNISLTEQDHQGVLDEPGRIMVSADLSQSAASQETFVEFFKQGLIHIFLGPDHVAFLLTLLLVSVLVTRDQRWVPAATVSGCIKAALVYVTTFTVAHSLTLSASALGWLALPIYAVELVIAGSVVIAALHNIRPYLPSSVMMVFLFGLIHGFGFASVLSELTAGEGSILWALFGFNLGVEAGQIAITLVVMPLFIALRQFRWYAQLFVRYLSVAIAALGSYWVLSRI